MELAKLHIPGREFIACPGCALIMTKVDFGVNCDVHCPRCWCQLSKCRSNPVRRILALSLAGLLLYLPAVFRPIFTFEILGVENTASIFTSTLSMFAQQQYLVGLIVVLTGLVIPLLTLLLLFIVSLGISLDWHWKWLPRLFRHYHHLTEWAMTDVYLIGVLITITKMSDMARVEFNEGFFCFTGMVLLTLATQTVMDKREFWSRMDSGDTVDDDPFEVHCVKPGTPPSSNEILICHSCHKTVTTSSFQDSRQHHCPRCNDGLQPRKTNSLQRTWALIICAVFFALPANLLPIMEVKYLGSTDSSTIMDGIIYFFQDGSYGIGLIIFIASILVPLFKILGLGLILFSIQFRRQTWLKHKTIMFRFIQFIGRWSMLDIFVIALLCAVVRFGILSTTDAGPAAFYFTGVVLSTMLAANSFDPRLLWDAAAETSK